MPVFPVAARYLWRTYLRLRRRTPGGFSGPQPIAWNDIDAFVRRTGITLAPWEIAVIEQIDDIYLSPEPKPTVPEGQTVKIAASASDAAGVRSVLAGIGKGRRVVKRKGRASNG